MFFRIGKTGRLSLRKQRVNHDEVLLHCARIGFNPLQAMALSHVLHRPFDQRQS
jgi:hypothetical protein